MRTFIKLFFILCIFSFANTAFSEGINASVDHHRISITETFTLSLTSEGQHVDDQPQLAPLEKSFDILGTSQSTQMSIANGNVTSQTSWKIRLAPKKEGEITIPPITIGQYTSEPITIEVLEAATPEDTDGEPIFLNVSVSEDAPYVQSQIIYSVKAFFGEPLHNASLTEPHVENALITRINDDKQYRKYFDGKMYEVLERRYAIFPQESGELTIAPPMLTGQKIIKNTQPQSGFDRFGMLNAKPVKLHADLITLNVKPQPDNYPGKWWIPAKDFSVTDKWSTSPPKFTEGEPVTRTITIEAKGLTAGQIPNIELPSTDEFKIYPEKPILHSREHSENVIGTQAQKIAYIATTPGKVTIPELKITWFDTDTKKTKTATLPKKTFTVAKGATSNASTHADIISEAVEPQPLTTHKNPWLWAAFIFAGLWIATFIAWQFKGSFINRGNENETEDENKISSQNPIHFMQDSCKRNSPKDTAAALIQWANTKWPGDTIRNLSDIVELIDSKELIDAIKELNRLLYADGEFVWDGERFWEVFRGVKFEVKKGVKEREDLPSLYL